MANDKIAEVGVNLSEKATLIWNIADILRGPFKPSEYGKVTLPMTVIKRFHDCLVPTQAKVLETYEKVKSLQVIDGFLTRASGYQFYNTSKFNFETLLADPENIETNFRDYLAGFSGNVQDVLAKFNFEPTLKKLVETNALYLIIKEFNTPKGYLGPDKISAVDCGYIFEDLVRRFSEAIGDDSGEHFTSRDIIYLMTDILLTGEHITDLGSVPVYDMTMGILEDSSLEKKAKSSDPQIFFNSIFPKVFDDAAQDSYIESQDTYTSLFEDKAKYNAVMQALAEYVYREMRAR